MELEYKFEITEDDLERLCWIVKCESIRLNRKTDFYFENEEKQKSLKNCRYINRVRMVEFHNLYTENLRIGLHVSDVFRSPLDKKEYFITHKLRRTVDGNEINEEEELPVSEPQFYLLREMMSSLNTKGSYCFTKIKSCLSFEKLNNIPTKLANNDVNVNIDISKITASDGDHYWFEIEAVGGYKLDSNTVFKNLDILCTDLGLKDYLNKKDGRMWKEILKGYGINN